MRTAHTLDRWVPIGGRLLPGLLLLVSACHVPTPTLLRDARRARSRGKSAQACPLWEALARRADLPRRLRFEVARSRVRCAQRRGTQARLHRAAIARLAEDPVVAHYTLALLQVATSRGTVSRALAHLRAARRLLPTEAELPYRTGRILLEAERFADAVPALRAALRLRPRWPEAQVALATALVALGRAAEARVVLRALPTAHLSPRLVARASRLMARAARLRAPVPPGARPLLDKALELLRLAFTAAAAQVLRKAAERYPHVAPIALLYGLSMLRLSNYAAALEWLRRAARLNPEDPAPFAHLGDVLSKTGHLESALRAYRRACALDPVHPSAHAGLGLTLLRLGRATDALPVLERAAVLAGQAVDVLDHLARALANAGRLDAAVRILRRAARHEEASADLLLRLARLLVQRYRSQPDSARAEADFREAVRLLRRALRERPNHAEAQTLLGRLTGTAPQKP